MDKEDNENELKQVAIHTLHAWHECLAEFGSYVLAARACVGHLMLVSSLSMMPLRCWATPIVLRT